MFCALTWVLLPVAVAVISDPDWEAFKQKFQKSHWVKQNIYFPYSEIR